MAERIGRGLQILIHGFKSGPRLQTRILAILMTRLSHYFLPTLKEDPAEARVPSHRLMLRAGMIRQLASGIYSWLPFGYAVLKNIEQIVREEMNKAGALEIFMPMVQPGDLWKEAEIGRASCRERV